ncbi:DENN domain-containing protein [Cavenderia fasciculata]|uniref:DENN domain-containing protein n=1 Tax=Cavenderia fasciculata TaxID=261658 RepID=F4PMF6_CACFS|nr:DENN domain-containing protein [Cavenderia fasciculata]EGG22806.1 DENN domain-containing protein [Cavenderia fasciculata]|eukprot:XP_004360657.1 DENN domain-containing protein [Cavenderia fasciculata]
MDNSSNDVTVTDTHQEEESDNIGLVAKETEEIIITSQTLVAADTPSTEATPTTTTTTVVIEEVQEEQQGGGESVLVNNNISVAVESSAEKEEEVDEFGLPIDNNNNTTTTTTSTKQQQQQQQQEETTTELDEEDEEETTDISSSNSSSALDLASMKITIPPTIKTPPKQTIFENFIVVGLSANNKSPPRIGTIHRPELLFSYPPDKPVPPKVQEFCFPNGISPYLIKRTPSFSNLNEVLYGQPYLHSSTFFYTFVLTGETPLYGICITKPELLSTIPNFFPEQPSPLERKPTYITASRSYCFISKYPLFNIHFDALLYLLAQDRLITITRELCSTELEGGHDEDQEDQNINNNNNNNSTNNNNNVPPPLPPRPQQKEPENITSTSSFTSTSTTTTITNEKPLESLEPITAPTTTTTTTEVSATSEEKEKETTTIIITKQEEEEEQSSLPQETLSTLSTPTSSSPSNVVDQQMVKNESDDFLKERDYKHLVDKKNLLDILHFYYSEVPVPKSGDILDFTLPGEVKRTYQIPAGKNIDEMNSKSVADWSVIGLFMHLSLENILKVLGAVLLEQRVVFVCDNLSVLSSACFSMTSFIFPFIWQGLFVPILPTALSDYLEAPVPYIVGVQTLKKRTCEGLIVDIANDKVQYNRISTPPLLPEFRKLQRNLSSDQQILLNEKNHNPIKNTPTQVEAIHRIFNTIQQYIWWLVKKIEASFILSEEILADSLKIQVLKTKFISTVSGHNKEFVSQLLDTQHFAHFLHNNLANQYQQQQQQQQQEQDKNMMSEQNNTTNTTTTSINLKIILNNVYLRTKIFKHVEQLHRRIIDNDVNNKFRLCLKGHQFSSLHECIILNRTDLFIKHFNQVYKSFKSISKDDDTFKEILELIFKYDRTIEFEYLLKRIQPIFEGSLIRSMIKKPPCIKMTQILVHHNYHLPLSTYDDDPRYYYQFSMNLIQVAIESCDVRLFNQIFQHVKALVETEKINSNFKQQHLLFSDAIKLLQDRGQGYEILFNMVKQLMGLNLDHRANLFRYALELDNLDVIEWIKDSYADSNPQEFVQLCQHYDELIERFASTLALRLINYQVPPKSTQKTTYNAEKYGNLDYILFLFHHLQYFSYFDSNIRRQQLSTALENGHLECARFIIEAKIFLHQSIVKKEEETGPVVRLKPLPFKIDPSIMSLDLVKRIIGTPRIDRQYQVLIESSIVANIPDALEYILSRLPVSGRYGFKVDDLLVYALRHPTNPQIMDLLLDKFCPSKDIPINVYEKDINHLSPIPLERFYAKNYILAINDPIKWNYQGFIISPTMSADAIQLILKHQPIDTVPLWMIYLSFTHQQDNLQLLQDSMKREVSQEKVTYHFATIRAVLEIACANGLLEVVDCIISATPDILYVGAMYFQKAIENNHIQVAKCIALAYLPSKYFTSKLAFSLILSSLYHIVDDLDFVYFWDLFQSITTNFDNVSRMLYSSPLIFKSQQHRVTNTIDRVIHHYGRYYNGPEKDQFKMEPLKLRNDVPDFVVGYIILKYYQNNNYGEDLNHIDFKSFDYKIYLQSNNISLLMFNQ